MACATNVGRELEAKRLELADFIKSKTVDGQLDFQGDDLKAFNDRNEEINKLHDKWMTARTVDMTAAENDASLKALQTIDRGGIFGGGDGRVVRGKSLGEIFTSSAEFKANMGNTRAEYEVVISDFSPRDAMKAITLTAAPPYPSQQPGFVEYAVRRPVVADLIPQTDTDQPSLVYLEQTTQTFAAAPVAEQGVKPESDLAWTRRTVPLETVAHWIKVTNQSLEDVAGIRDEIDQQMTLGLMLAEEVQLLTGDGSSPDIQGFLTKSGVQTQSLGSDDEFTAAMKAFNKIRFTGFADVTGGVIHPNDAVGIVTKKDSTGRFIYGDPKDAVTNLRLWGVPHVQTTAITEGTALYGDFVMFSRIFRKGGIRILVGLVDDDLKRNQQTIVVEERLLLQIKRAAAFCTLTGI